VGEIRKTLHRAAGDLRIEVHGVGRDPSVRDAWEEQNLSGKKGKE